jgi:CRP-like cAMP-binding protein
MDSDQSQENHAAPASAPTSGGEALDRGRLILSRSPLRGLAKGTLDALLALAKVERLPRRYRISQQDETAQIFAILGSGRVKLERMGPSHSFPLAHRGPGDIVGESAIGGAPAQENAVVVDDAEALVFPAEAFRALLGRDPPLQEAMSRTLLGIQRAIEERLASLLLRGVEARLAGFLLDADDRWGTEHAAGTVISAPFTHADIALLIGSTRETVTLQLGKLKRTGLIELDRRRIVIRDRGGLARRAEGS